MALKLGIDLGGTKIEGVVLGDQHEVLWRERRATPQGDYHRTLQVIGELVDVATTSLSLSKDLPLGVGIPGTLSKKTGLVKNANSVCLIGKPLDRDLSQRLGRPVRLANDANCFALSEASDGAAAGADVVFGVILGTGVGGGLVVHKQIVSGCNGIGGEWGHNPLPWPRPEELPGPNCYCGKQGCIETFLSGTGFAQCHLREFHQAWTAKEIMEGCRQGDLQCRSSFDKYCDRLARGLATIINVLDPDLIVLGGGMSNVEELYVEVPRFWGKYVFSDSVDTKLVKARFGDSSGVRGAAWLNS